MSNIVTFPCWDLLRKEDQKIAEIVGLICNVCKDLVTDPIVVSCDHTACVVCKICLVDTFNPCKICSKPQVTTEGRLLNKCLKQKLQYHCPYWEDGCTITTTYDKFEDHYKSCKFNGILCECGQIIASGHMEEHKKNTCVLRSIEYAIDSAHPGKLLVDANQLVNLLNQQVSVGQVHSARQVNDAETKQNTADDAFFDTFTTALMDYLKISQTGEIEAIMDKATHKYIKLSEAINNIDTQREELVKLLAGLQQRYKSAMQVD